MRITELHLRQLGVKLAEPLPPRGDVGYTVFQHAGTENQTLLVMEIRTDAGLAGVTALAWAGPEARQRVATHLGPALLGADPTRVWDCVRRLRALGRQPSDRAIVNRLEFALWDILGKAHGQPLYRLLGGGMDSPRVRVYASSLYFRPVAELVAEARRIQRRGFRRMKIKIGHGPEEDLDLIRAIREAVGPEVGLLLDANRAYDLPGARRLVACLKGAAMEWLEEPFPYVAGATAPTPWACDRLDAWALEQYRRLREASSIPLAGAEGFGDYELLHQLLAAGALAVVQPDTGHLGVLAMLGAMGLAAQHRVTFTPHACCDAVALVVSLHLQALLGNAAPQEYETFESPLVQQLLVGQRDWLRAEGTVAVPTAPGLGVTLDEATCERYGTAREILRA